MYTFTMCTIYDNVYVHVFRQFRLCRVAHASNVGNHILTTSGYRVDKWSIQVRLWVTDQGHRFEANR